MIKIKVASKILKAVWCCHGLALTDITKLQCERVGRLTAVCCIPRAGASRESWWLWGLPRSWQAVHT